MLENTLWQLLDHGVGRGMLFVFYLCIPLAIGVEEYGRFAFVQAAVGLAVQPAILLGLDLIVVKRTARGDASAFGHALVARSLLLVATGAAVGLVGAAIAPDDLLLIWSFWLYFGLLALEALVFAHFRALEQMRLEGIAGAVQKALALPLLGLFTLSGARGAEAPAVALAVTAAAGLLLLPLLAPRDMALLAGRVRDRAGGISGIVPIVRESTVAGLAALAALVYFRIDSVLLGILAGSEEVGVYNLAHRMMEATLIVPAIIANVVFPRVARAAGRSPSLRRTALGLGVLGALVSAALFCGGERLVTAIYGAEQALAGRTLSILALAVAPVYAGYVLTQALIAADRQRAYLRLGVRAVLFNVALNLALIPPLGAWGAAAAAVATEAAVVAMAVLALR